MIVAHNLCFSTLVGRLRDPRAPRDSTPRPEDSDSDASKDASDDGHVPRGDRAARAPAPAEGRTGLTEGRLGVVEHWPDAAAAAALRAAEARGRVYVAPHGAVFASSQAREGALPRMLREVLAARVLTKKALKRALRAKRGTLARVLDARQLALKLVANVTYGYCAASFSGRQPCAELADAIVGSGRRCLEDAIDRAGGAATADDPGRPVKYPRQRRNLPSLKNSYFDRRRLREISTSWTRCRRDPPPRKTSTG